MLNRFRGNFLPLIDKMGALFSTISPIPSFWTLVAIGFAAIAAAIYASSSMGAHWYLASLFGGIAVLISGFFDIIDGSVARLQNRESRKGAFFDSLMDKVGETIIFIGLAASSLVNPVSCVFAIAASLLVSYSRARAESLGVEIKGIGIGERAERLLILSIIGFIPVEGAVHAAVIIVGIVASFTVFQRYIETSKHIQ